jgi:hypothetical protein
VTTSAGAPEVCALAARLATAAKLPPPVSLTGLAGGKNNRVYRVTLEGRDAPVVLKCYFSDARDVRDRRHAEWTFLERAWAAGIRNVPEPLATEPAAHAALYSFVTGGKLAPGEVADAHVAAAIRFVVAINRTAGISLPLPTASEACFSIAAHVDTVDRRVARLANLDGTAPRVDDARRLVADRLVPAWTRIRSRILALPGDATEELGQANRCISPSDFGFHNALVSATGDVSFIDFEYAGRDDPAKLVCDFFCQPEIPVPTGHLDGVLDGLSGGLPVDAHFRDRAMTLLDAYRIKWACIILNEFLPVDAARRAFADAGAREARCEIQLAKAAHTLSQVDETA